MIPNSPLNSALNFTQASPAARFEGIDILRGLAALCVVFSHYTSHWVKLYGEIRLHVELIYGYYAVQLFFIISGFVIYLTVERSKTWYDFAVSRLTRLYPAYWIALTFVVAVEVLAFGQTMWWSGYVANMTMLQGFLGFENHDNVFWSLTVELVFYGVIAALFKAGHLARIGAAAVIALLICWALSLLDIFFGIGIPTLIARYLILQNIPFFVLGVTLYFVHTRGISAKRIATIVASFATVWTMQGPVNFLVSLLLFALAALAVRGQLRYFASPITLWLGAISYSLYLTHRNLGYLVIDALHEHGFSSSSTFLITTAGALVLASALTYGIERPTCAYLRNAYLRRIRHNLLT